MNWSKKCIFLFTGHYDKKECTNLPTKHDNVEAAAISDNEIVARFLKPINDDYDYGIFYKQYRVDEKLKGHKHWATYGPIWTDYVDKLKPKKQYQVGIVIYCAQNSSIHNKNYKFAYLYTLKECKAPFKKSIK